MEDPLNEGNLWSFLSVLLLSLQKSILWTIAALVSLNTQFHGLIMSTELHLISPSLCCKLKTLSKSFFTLHLNCLMSTVLKTILYRFCFYSSDRRINPISVIPPWPKAEVCQDIFSLEFLIVFIECVVLNALLSVLIETLIISFLHFKTSILDVKNYFSAASLCP